jgi:hypothetical protein
MRDSRTSVAIKRQIRDGGGSFSMPRIDVLQNTASPSQIGLNVRSFRPAEAISGRETCEIADVDGAERRSCEGIELFKVPLAVE